MIRFFAWADKADQQKGRLIKTLKAEQKFVRQRSVGRRSHKPSSDKGTISGSWELFQRAAGFSRSQHLKGLECRAKEWDSCLEN